MDELDTELFGVVGDKPLRIPPAYRKHCVLQQNAGYAKSIIKRINKLTGKDGSMNYAEGKKNYFLDWPTRGTDDEIPGTAAIMMIAAEKLFNYTGDKIVRSL